MRQSPCPVSLLFSLSLFLCRLSPFLHRRVVYRMLYTRERASFSRWFTLSHLLHFDVGVGIGESESGGARNCQWSIVFVVHAQKVRLPRIYIASLHFSTSPPPHQKPKEKPQPTHKSRFRARGRHNRLHLRAQGEADQSADCSAAHGDERPAPDHARTKWPGRATRCVPPSVRPVERSDRPADHGEPGPSQPRGDSG